MRMLNAKQDVLFILSWFQEAFSSPSFRLFSSFIVGFIQLGREGHTSSMVQALSRSSLSRSLSSFTRFLGRNRWAMDEVLATALHRFFHTFKIKTRSVVFLLLDDTIIKKTGKKIPGCGWYKDHAQNLAHVFGHQWVLAALFHKQSVLPLGARLYHPRGAKGCGRFHTKISLAKKILQSLHLPVACKVYVLADSWYWCKELSLLCLSYGYHMISQLKSNSIVWVKGQRTPVVDLGSRAWAFREVSFFLYGKNKTLRNAKFIAVVKGFGPVAVEVVQEKRKKIRYLVSTNFLLPALEVVKFYAHRWKIEQMIKDLKQRLGLGDYRVRNLQAIQRHVALVLLSYFTLILLKILQWLNDKKTSLGLSIRTLALQVRRQILIETITMKLNTLKIQFKQNILDSYLKELCA